MDFQKASCCDDHRRKRIGHICLLLTLFFSQLLGSGLRDRLHGAVFSNMPHVGVLTLKIPPKPEHFDEICSANVH